MPISAPKGRKAKKVEAASEAQELRKLRYITPDDLPIFYANNAGLRMTPMDFRLTFGRIGKQDDEGLDVHEVVAVYFSPQHAKALLGLLARQVTRFETDFGPIADATTVTEAADGE